MKEFTIHPPIKINYTHPLVLRLEEIHKDRTEVLLWEKVHDLEEQISTTNKEGEATLLAQFLNDLARNYSKSNYWSKKIIDIIKNYLKGD